MDGGVDAELENINGLGPRTVSGWMRICYRWLDLDIGFYEGGL